VRGKAGGERNREACVEEVSKVGGEVKQKKGKNMSFSVIEIGHIMGLIC
jgi:hypothetical protein